MDNFSLPFESSKIEDSGVNYEVLQSKMYLINIECILFRPMHLSILLY